MTCRILLDKRNFGSILRGDVGEEIRQKGSRVVLRGGFGFPPKEPVEHPPCEANLWEVVERKGFTRDAVWFRRVYVYTCGCL